MLTQLRFQVTDTQQYWKKFSGRRESWDGQLVRHLDWHAGPMCALGIQGHSLKCSAGGR